MGIILEEDARRGRVIVSGFTEGSAAEKSAKVCAMSSYGTRLMPMLSVQPDSTLNWFRAKGDLNVEPQVLFS
jgi:hypothetical protein